MQSLFKSSYAKGCFQGLVAKEGRLKGSTKHEEGFLLSHSSTDTSLVPRTKALLKGTNGFPEPSLLASHAREHGFKSQLFTPPIHTSGLSIVLAPLFSVLTRKKGQ